MSRSLQVAEMSKASTSKIVKNPLLL